MKKLFFLSLWLGVTSSSAHAQQLTFRAGYEFLWAGTWDRTFQTYNFSRPFLTEPQPSFQNGLTASASLLFPSDVVVHHGFGISWSTFGSKASTPGLDNWLRLHLLKLGYILHLGSTSNGFYSEFSLSAIGGQMSRKYNVDGFVVDDGVVTGVGFGAEVEALGGVYVRLRDGFALSPFISAGYAHYYSPSSERVINQTSGIIDVDFAPLVQARAGLAFHFGQ